MSSLSNESTTSEVGIASKLKAQDFAFFESRFKLANWFTKRFPGGIEYGGKRVLDFGCGEGALAFQAFQSGANEILGIDVNPRLIASANQIQVERFPESIPKVNFQVMDILGSDLEGFDIVQSQATFEHVVDLKSYLDAIYNLLKTGGRVYTGFSPLYHAPWGDHRRLKAPGYKWFPWSHLMFSRRWLIDRFNKLHATERIETIEDLGLNGYSLKQYETIFEESKFKISHFEVNNQSSRIARLIEPFRVLPVVRELLSISIFAILEK